MPEVECHLPDALLKNLLQPMKGFSDESVEKKHRLIASRYQEIRVRNYKVVSLYLLTGEGVMPYQPPCFGCGRGLDEQDVPWKYCEPCWRAKGEPDEADECWELGKRPMPSSNRQQSPTARVHPGVFELESSRVKGCNATSHGL
jgi:hypothetical protein